LGKTALRPDVLLQPAAFIAGRQLTFFRVDEHFKELALFAVSSQYLEIRQRHQISVDS
jgi:hypothetical protein